ncbi:uncharacterized protein M421DRAFT_91754 [Didymella exigua CBS 183.55]|uniref:Uncharacterized protein n=1 Tax=Didymella exigua CBS 183.55 TaxID=1150837 RepID=A0A6A5RNB1_9PLEO|nr:uncharacterized protein M421DRAFT_91754 [Didymella exigua CBS 183.55]KAF1929262.1 hypothetical protein M421DRAFT_91754 [Didymella exigua CBS 183.55]
MPAGRLEEEFSSPHAAWGASTRPLHRVVPHPSQQSRLSKPVLPVCRITRRGCEVSRKGGVKASQMRECCVLHSAAFQRAFSYMAFFKSSHLSPYNPETTASSTTSTSSSHSQQSATESLPTHHLILHHCPVFVLQVPYLLPQASQHPLDLSTSQPPNQSICAQFSTSSTTSAGAGFRSLTDRTDKYFESADKLKRNASALLAPIHSEITTSLPGVRAHAKSACGSRSCIKRPKYQEEARTSVSDSMVLYKTLPGPHPPPASTNATTSLYHLLRLI